MSESRFSHDYKVALVLAGTNKFTGDGLGYAVWRQHLDCCFKIAGLTPQTTEEKQELKEMVEAVKLNEMYCKHIILGALSSLVAAQFVQNTAQEIITLLEATYNSRTPAARSEARAEYHSLSLQDGDVSTYCQKSRAVIARLKHMGVTLSNDEMVDNLFNGLPEQFQQVKVIGEDSGKTDFDYFVQRVIEWGRRRKYTDAYDRQHHVALLVKNKSPDTNNDIGEFRGRCFNCDKTVFMTVLLNSSNVHTANIFGRIINQICVN